MLQKVNKFIIGILLPVLCFIGIGIKNDSYISHAAMNDWQAHWAKNYIQQFIDKGYVDGYPDGTFKPNNSITRAEFVRIVNNYFGLTKSSGKIFSDTKLHWAKIAIDIAVTNGVCNGKSDIEFKPDDPITREEAAVMASNYKNIKEVNHEKLNEYTDRAEVSNWAKDGVESVIENGYMGGYSDNTFRPKNKITRAEAIVTLSRVWSEDITGDVSQNNASSRQYFAKEGDWMYYYNYPEQAIYKIKTDGTNKAKLVQTGGINGSHMAVKDGYLYYTIHYSNRDGEVWRINVDGGEKKQITSVFGVAWFGNLYFYKDNIYFTESTLGMHSSKLDGSSLQHVNIRPRYCGLWENKIYYTNYNENDSIYELNLDTNEKTKINNNDSYDINVYEEYIYFINRNDNNKIYRTKIGGDTEKVSDETTVNMNVDNGWIYYRNEKDNDKLYKIKIDGTNKTKLSDDPVGDIYIVGDWIFYAKYGITEYFLIKNDGSLKYKL